MSYIPNTDNDRREMLARIGVKNTDELLEVIPGKLRMKRPLDIPALSEMEVLDEINALSKAGMENLVCFAGGGVYDHFIPSAIGPIVSRPEFMTAYTPYQPEVSQGTLQVIYEFQTHICRLTGMDVANASLYDGATAAAEAVLLAARTTRRDRIIVSETVNPLYREVIETYLSGRNMEIVIVPMKNGLADIDGIKSEIDDKTSGVLLSQPNFFGLLEDIDSVTGAVHEHGAKLILAVDPIAQAVLKTPGEYGADIVIGEGQPFGIPLSFGGPLLGFMAAEKSLVRNMPGRIVGRAEDVDGKKGFVLTLQTREQHIRREKATSNICTNEALCATTASVYLSLMGRTGLKQVALLSIEKARETYRRICEVDGFEPYFKQSFVREFAVKTPIPAKDAIRKMVERGILPGINAGRWYKDMDDCLIIALTEKRTKQEIDSLVDGLREIG